MSNIMNDLTYTSIETISAYDIQTGAHLYTLDELQNATIAQTQEKTDITGKQGRKLSSLKKNKAVTVSATNGMVSGGLMEMQTGGKFEDKVTDVKWVDYLSVASNSATTNYKAVGTAGNEIEFVYVKKNDVVVKTLTQDATAGADKFAYDPTTKKITFNEGELEDGTEIVAHYKRKIQANVMANMSDTYSGKAALYVDVMAEDKCANVYRVQYYFPKADVSGEFSLEFGDNQTVHAFEAESLAGACGTGGALWYCTVFGVDAQDQT